MQLQHIELNDLKIAKLNVRKKGAKDTSDLEASIQSIGLIQPLLVRPTRGAEDNSPTGIEQCEGFEVVAGQRRYYALSKLAEAQEAEPVPCIVMEDGDDAKAIEASLAENVARLPMHEVDQYKAFSTLSKQGKSVEDIALHFGITERGVQQRLALGNLHPPILTAYQNEDIRWSTIQALTMATLKKQKEWYALFKSEDETAPLGQFLKTWLLGGGEIPVDNALFDLETYNGAIVSDLFGDNRYFDDATAFWELQNQAIADLKTQYENGGWQDIIVLDVGAWWANWEYAETPKEEGGRIYIQIAADGEVTIHEGFITEKEAKRRLKQQANNEEGTTNTKPEITKPMQNYLGLHRHSAVRSELLGNQDIALRLCVAQIIAGSDLWSVHADPQKAEKQEIADSLDDNKAESTFAQERERIRALLGMEQIADDTLVYRKDDWGKSHDVHEIFATLLKLDDASVNMILTFVVAETLPRNTAMVDVLGNMLSVDMADHWKPDQTFFDLMRDKEAINAMVKHAAGKTAADANITATAKAQKSIIQDCLTGARKGGKKNWQPRYMDFPMRSYTKRGCIDAIDQYKAVKKHYVA